MNKQTLAFNTRRAL